MSCPVAHYDFLCAYALNVEDYTCSTCQESAGVTCLTVSAPVDGVANYWSIDQQRSSECGGFLGLTQTCSYNTVKTPCRGNPPAFTTFQAAWELKATSSQTEITLTTSLQNTQKTTFTNSLKLTSGKCTGLLRPPRGGPRTDAPPRNRHRVRRWRGQA